MKQFILLKNIESTTKNTKQIYPIRHFLRSIRLKSHAMKRLLQNLKSPIQTFLIQMVFQINLINCKKKEHPNARVFFCKIYYRRALQDTQKLWDLYGQGDGEIASSPFLNSYKKIYTTILQVFFILEQYSMYDLILYNSYFSSIYFTREVY